jgi:hypothetical protein
LNWTRSADSVIHARYGTARTRARGVQRKSLPRSSLFIQSGRSPECLSSPE